MRSASTTVDSRCAITIVVRPRSIASSVAWMSASVLLSSALVASSRIRIGGSLSRVRAIAHALLLAARKLEPALADARVEALGQATG